MHVLTIALEVLLPLLYFSTVWVYGKSFFSSSAAAAGVRRGFLAATVGAHALYAVLRTVSLGRAPLTSLPEVLSMVALAVGAVYLAIEIRTGNRETGYFLLMLPFFLQAISSVLIDDALRLRPDLLSAALGLHVAAALLGYAALTIAAGYGLLYLMLYHNLKASRFGVLYQRLPDLETLERMSFTAALAGTALLTAAIVVGAAWLSPSVDAFTWIDPKPLTTVAVWGVLVFGLVTRSAAGWKGRRMVVVTMAGFALAVLSVAVTAILPYGFHRFG